MDKDNCNVCKVDKNNTLNQYCKFGGFWLCDKCQRKESFNGKKTFNEAITIVKNEKITNKEMAIILIHYLTDIKIESVAVLLRKNKINFYNF